MVALLFALARPTDQAEEEEDDDDEQQPSQDLSEATSSGFLSGCFTTVCVGTATERQTDKTAVVAVLKTKFFPTKCQSD